MTPETIIQALIDNSLIVCAKMQCEADNIDNLHLLISVATGVFASQNELYNVFCELKFNSQAYN